MKEDITIRLALAALEPESVDPAEMEELLREAILEIDSLRVRAFLEPPEPDLIDVEPIGRA